jgi:S-DNA-T family DNA segregation ATPase FtsK/SpoIIIE
MAPRDALAHSDPGLDEVEAKPTAKRRRKKKAKPAASVPSDTPELSELRIADPAELPTMSELDRLDAELDAEDAAAELEGLDDVEPDEVLPHLVDDDDEAGDAATAAETPVPKKRKAAKKSVKKADEEETAKSRRGGAKKSASAGAKKKAPAKKKAAAKKKAPAKGRGKRTPTPHRSKPPQRARAPLARELVGIGLFAFALLTLLSLLSYDAADPGFGVSGAGDVHNWIGPFGAYLADGFTLTLGLGAFLMPGLLVAGGWLCFRPVLGRPAINQVGGAILAAVSVAVFLDVVIGRHSGLDYPAGGLIGALIAGKLVSLVAPLGTGILSVAGVFVGANLIINRPLGHTVSDVARLGRLLLRYAREELAIWMEKQRLLKEERERLMQDLLEEEERFRQEQEAAKGEEAEERIGAKAEARAKREMADAEKRAQEEAAAAALAAVEAEEAAKKAAEEAARLEAEKPVIISNPGGGADPAWALVQDTEPGAPVLPLDQAISDPVVDGKNLALSNLGAAPLVDAPHSAPQGNQAAKAKGGPNDTQPDGPASGEDFRIVEVDEDDAAKKVAEAEQEEVNEFENYELPPLKLLDYDAPERKPVDPAKLHSQAQTLLSKFRDFGIDGKVREVRPGPVCTTYEFVPAPGIKVSKIAALSDDIAMAMEAVHVRIVAPIPGKGAVGIEIPNETRETVYLKEIVADPGFRKSGSKLQMALGKTIEGKPFTADLAGMPHVLISGTTGSGKSVSVNGMICSILYRATPEEVKFLMIDPKMLELSIYEGIPHLLLPPITDSKKAAVALRWAVDEMERRYQAMSEMGVRDLEGFNEMVTAIKDGEVEKDLPKQPDGKEYGKLPYIVVVVDEYADLLAIAGKDVEGYIMRLAQKARAAGIHVMLATQRPSVDVITGVIKANFPVRMGFRLASSHDSKTIVNRPGAEKLLGRGDMLMMPAGTSNLTRVHGAFISEKELHRVVEFLKEQAKPQYDETILISPEEDDAGGIADEEKDAKWEDAIRVVARGRKCSTSWLQRQLGIGYNRAARIVEMMEREGLVGPQISAKGYREIHLPPPDDY